MSALTELQTRCKAEITSHWDSCREHGLPHNPVSMKQVVGAFEQFFDAMGRTSPMTEAAALAAIKPLYVALDEINAANDHGLLETDERELLVPFVIDTVAAVGLDPAAFPNGEPGGEFREF